LYFSLLYKLRFDNFSLNEDDDDDDDLLLLLLLQSHRVMIPEQERERLKVRRSLVFFAHPDDDVTVTCVDGSDRYPPVNSAEYLDERIHSTYTYIHDTAT